MFSGINDASFGSAARPGVSNFPWLEMDVREAVLLKRLGGPVICCLELRRSGQARSDVVRNIFKILRGFAVVTDFGEDFFVGRREGRGIVGLRRQQSA